MQIMSPFSQICKLAFTRRQYRCIFKVCKISFSKCSILKPPKRCCCVHESKRLKFSIFIKQLEMYLKHLLIIICYILYRDFFVLKSVYMGGGGGVSSTHHQCAASTWMMRLQPYAPDMIRYLIRYDIWYYLL